MAPLVSTIEIACTPEEVFSVATDPRRFAEWQRDVVNVRMLGEAHFATTRRISGAERAMIQQITRNDPPMAGLREASTAPSVRTPRSLSSRSTAVPGHESSSLLSSKATELASPCYRWYVSKRTQALQTATGTSRTCSNVTSELIQWTGDLGGLAGL
jgi:Polyketide cyclase / dehydrase and lipid transport